jgi:hypothetical protein
MISAGASGVLASVGGDMVNAPRHAESDFIPVKKTRYLK